MVCRCVDVYSIRLPTSGNIQYNLKLGPTDGRENTTKFIGRTNGDMLIP